jgi:N-acetylneuraminate synthase/N,N'-diacetyllegionaminate synthase
MSIGLNKIKTSSADLTNYPFLKNIAKYNTDLIISTGMSDLNDIQNSLDVLSKYGQNLDNMTILHCNSEYPTPMNDVNLKAMHTIKSAFNVEIGYSDHTLGIEVPIAAVALGAKVIEKHFTLDRKLPGPDHSASLEPEELKQMVKSIRNIEKALSGDGKKKLSKSESKNVSIVRKSIHLKKDLSKGHVITEEDILVLRPGDGISPMEWNNIIGDKLLEDKSKFDKLSYSDLNQNYEKL